ncbi:Peptidase C19, ubiquitin carboxyl-terminal hydrolase 2 [Corchorus olitorius]|uniref:Peptidase C19, ubiquitin carboxyl-terminal hydrolase 2 n=1 Tax=Corchorus olitorius TaxID=93759 RepID=A0A1R3H305_9ROSI|nr:Peptidase C19, ubiquitin carboxyl-terminal hydrolase 2 [Corchorus olitorius]
MSPVQSLIRVTPLRNFFLIPENYQHCNSPLVHRFGELTRKIWHARNFKGQVSPHEFLEAVMKANLRTSEESSSIIHVCFQGELEVVKETQSKAISEKKESIGEQNGVLQTKSTVLEKDNSVVETYRMPFLMLELDLPEPLVFRDVMEKNIIPQVPLFNILKKFDGETVTSTLRHPARMRYRVTRLPQYLILHMHRFTRNVFFREKNPTLVILKILWA